MENIFQQYKNSKKFQKFLTLITSEKNNIFLSDAKGSFSSVLLSYMFKNTDKSVLLILENSEESSFFYNDIKNIIGEENLFFFPSSYRRSVQYGQIDQVNLVFRTECLNRVAEKKKSFIVSYASALLEKVPTNATIKENSLKLKVYDTINIEKLNLQLHNFGFERTDFVYEPGQFSIRGGIIDIFSFSDDYPFRMGLFGDEIESIRRFNIESQLSLSKETSFIVSPNLSSSNNSAYLTDFISLLNKDFKICSNNFSFIKDTLNSEYESVTAVNETLESEDFKILSKDYLTSGTCVLEKIEDFGTVEFGFISYFSKAEILQFNINHQPKFNKNLDLLKKDLETSILNGYKIFILTDSESQKERFKEILNGNKNIHYSFIETVLHRGFRDEDERICFYTDHEIFNRHHKNSVRTNFSSKKAAITLKEINELQKGDYIVHIDFGVGKFIGLQTIEIQGKKQEVIRLEYKDKDTLFVNIHSLHKISKYRSKDGTPPSVHKLGTSTWSNTKNKAKSKLKDIAADLIRLYAERKQEKGFAYSADSFMQQELEASFLYEDTPDQLQTTIEVKEDMEKQMPMDRLVCGDVGFGKTEIAIRAAFKAVADNKQVAVLVPTTVLAFQHYRSFTKRLRKFPCRIEYLTRFKSAKEQKQILASLENGKIDIVIGTHKLVSNDVKFKDLGLLIIDEEQKFGVSVKEKLRQIKVNVDTLTLTATPIPRTLELSLMGARDISIIKTPPPNRLPIVTELHTFNEDIIIEAITYEIERGGQVFFIHNRVQNIIDVQAIINRLLPKVRTVIAHGQMPGEDIEERVLSFMNGDYDVLISTTIVENGIDVPNANTIIINQAQSFGLSELHQLRGRVGRSNKRAFCYIITPPLGTLGDEAKRRLKAIVDFSELGSGINIAMQDLDIRGAGNVLGAEQSGYITEIGYETYIRILEEAMEELKYNDFKDVYAEEIAQEVNSYDYTTKNNRLFVHDCHIETDLEILIPKDYIYSDSERILIYKQFDNLKNDMEIDKLASELVDKFGELPQSVIDLFDVVRLRKIALTLGIERIIIKYSNMSCYFVSEQNSPFYASETFGKILVFVQTHPKECRIKEDRKLSLTFSGIVSIQLALNTLEKVNC